MNYINLIIGLICIIIVILNYTIIPKNKRFGIILTLANLVAAILNILIFLVNEL